MTRTLTILLAACLLLGSCSRQTPPATSTPSIPGAAPWSGHVLRGTDPEALRRYFQTVQEVKAKKFNVQWNPATVAIDRETAMRSLRHVSSDGVTYVFAAAEPVVAKLKPGSILWVRDLALRKVDAVDTQDGLPIPIESVQKLARKLSPKKEIFNHSREVLDPPIKACEI